MGVGVSEGRGIGVGAGVAVGRTTFAAVSVGCVRAGVGRGVARGVGVAVGTLVVVTLGVVAFVLAAWLRLFRRGRVEAVRGRSASPSPRTERPGVEVLLL